MALKAPDLWSWSLNQPLPKGKKKDWAYKEFSPVVPYLLSLLLQKSPLKVAGSSKQCKSETSSTTAVSYDSSAQCFCLRIYHILFACTVALYCLRHPLPWIALEFSPLAAHAMWWMGKTTTVLHSTVKGDLCRQPSTLALSLVFNSLMFCCFQRKKREHKVLCSSSSPLLSLSTLWLSQSSPCG